MRALPSLPVEPVAKRPNRRRPLMQTPTSLIPSEVEGRTEGWARPSTQFIQSDAEGGVEGLGMSGGGFKVGLRARAKPSQMLPFLALLLLAACGPLVQVGGNDKPPASLLTLRASATPAATVPANPRTLLVLTPAAAGALQTLRLPVTVGDTSLQYLTGASWSEQPAKLFRRVLADTIAAHGVTVIDPRAPALPSARTLSGTLVEFGLDVRNPAAPVVRVRYDAMLGGGGGALAVRRFEKTLPAGSRTAADVAAALNDAANDVADDVADWVAG